MEWQLAEAKNKLSEVMTRAMTDGPQRIRRRGQVAVLIAEDEYERLAAKRPSLLESIMDGPDLSDLDLQRDQSPPRDIDR